MRTDLFDFSFSAGSALDIGRTRRSNMDRVIFYPNLGFFAVADGMGGLANGEKAAEMLTELVPGFVITLAEELRGKGLDAAEAGRALKERLRLVSDHIFRASNTEDDISFGSTLSCVWLIAKSAVFVNLGDSRGFLLSAGGQAPRQITEDHNLAGELVRAGELSRAEARNHPTSSQLIQFMGMPPPACPDCFIEPVSPGDGILVCSDGLYGMVEDSVLTEHMRGGGSPDEICRDMVDAANEAGGRDNISVVYIKIEYAILVT
jgi:serine/threonine protein phosphatase PrpC